MKQEIFENWYNKTLSDFDAEVTVEIAKKEKRVWLHVFEAGYDAAINETNKDCQKYLNEKGI